MAERLCDEVPIVSVEELYTTVWLDSHSLADAGQEKGGNSVEVVMAVEAVVELEVSDQRPSAMVCSLTLVLEGYESQNSVAPYWSSPDQARHLV